MRPSRYDSGGNSDSTGYTTGAGNEMTSGGGYTYTYDNAGNTISKTQLSTAMSGPTPMITTTA